MTTATEPAPTGTRCERCGAPVAPDQEWCIECGTARTMIQRPRGWTVPLAVVGTVVLLFAAGFAIALVNLSSEANRDAAALSTTTSSTTTAPSAQPFAKWPAGAKGWTVVLAGSASHATAEALATPIRASGIIVGILNSSRHKAMTPGQWLVFYGHDATRAAARAQARSLTARGHPGVVRLVAPPTTS